MVIFQEGEADPFVLTSQAGKQTGMTLFYATDRSPAGLTSTAYTSQPAKTIRLGEAQAVFGEGVDWQKIQDASSGKKSSSGLALRVGGFKELGAVATETREKSPHETQPFVDRMNERLHASDSKRIGILVHGFHMGFEEAGSITGLWAHEFGRRGVGMWYAWPADSVGVSYTRDKRVASESAPKFAELLVLLATQTDAEKINIGGYSAGAGLVIEALLVLKDHDMVAQVIPKLNFLALTAADIKLQPRLQSHLQTIYPMFDRVLIPVSPDDPALGLAATLFDGPRLGSATVKQINPDDLKWIEAADRLEIINLARTAADPQDPALQGRGVLGHEYPFKDRWFASDFWMLINTELPAKDRGLVRSPDEPSWFMPNDYADRARAALAEYRRKK